MRDEELRTRLQALAAAGRVEPGPSAMRLLRRRGRRRVRNTLAVSVVGVLVVVGGVRLLPEQGDDTGVAVAPTGEPATLVGLRVDGDRMRLAVLDTRTGQLRRWLPGGKLTGPHTISPDLRKLYLYQRGKDPCASTWTEVDLTTGATRPAFGGHPVDIVPTPSPDGRYVAFPTACPPQAGLVILDVISGRQRVLTTPAGAERGDWPLQWTPDSTRLGYLLRRPGRPQQVFHVLPVEGTTSITQGRDLPLPRGPDCDLGLPPHFRGNGRVVVVEECRGDSFLVDLDLQTGRTVARVALGLQASVFDVVVDRSGAHILLLARRGAPTVKQTPRIYVVRDGRAERVHNGCECWQVAW